MADSSYINLYGVTSRMAREFRRLGKWGQHLADFLGNSSRAIGYPGFGNGTGYTVANWISDGYFANLSEVQTFYPICQSTADTVDWVLLQSAIDDTIYGSLGSSVFGSTKRLLMISAGKYVCNRSLSVGYGRVGTPPSGLNGNGYITITIKGEGAQVDRSGNGMTGVTIVFTSQVGIATTLGQNIQIEDVSLIGPHMNWFENNAFTALHSAAVSDVNTWKPTGIADENWVGGNAVSIGVGCDIYCATGSAAAYPARPLPALFGGGTTNAVTGGGVSGTGVFLKNVNISGFIIGQGHPHGDSNGEFIRHDGGTISHCVYPIVSSHSQARNNNATNVNCYLFYSALGSQGGTRSNANIHGGYYNNHVGYGYQFLNHPNADWSGVLTIHDSYSEGLLRIGKWAHNARFDGCFFSFYEQEAQYGVPASHYDITHLVLDGCTLTGLRHGLVCADPSSRIDIINATEIGLSSNPNWASHANLALIQRGLDYMG